MTLHLELTPSNVQQHLQSVLSLADQNKRELGFLPNSVFGEQARRGRLWTATDSETNLLLGYILWGGRYPDLRIIQIFEQGLARGRGVGRRLVEELVRFGEQNGFSAITARVASDLSANSFWQQLGFQQLKQTPGGRTTKRTINIRVRYLNVPLLFAINQHLGRPKQQMSYDFLPILEPTIYALDLNAIIDILNQRAGKDAVAALLRASFNNLVQLRMTDEAAAEVSRKQSSDDREDQMLQLIQQLPRLPPLQEKTIHKLLQSLRQIVFPFRNPTRKKAPQDHSDLVHLASCIHFKLHGFVTSDRSLLRAAPLVHDAYGLEIISPATFLAAESAANDTHLNVAALIKNEELYVGRYSESDHTEVMNFLAQRFSERERRAAWLPGSQGAERIRVCGRVNGRLIGIAAWDLPNRLHLETNLYLAVDESAPTAVRFIDHVLERISRPRSLRRCYRVLLHHGIGEIIARNTARTRGFISLPGREDHRGALVKVFMPHPVGLGTWSWFCNQVQELAPIAPQKTLPAFPQAQEDGIVVTNTGSGLRYSIDLFDFETAISPGIIVFPDREALVIPIRRSYADDLLGGVSDQRSLLPEAEALLRLERAYFRSPTGAGVWRRGMPAIFYVSGSGNGPMAAVACARITSSMVLPASEVALRYQRQGVLSRNAIDERASNDGRVHVITFDSISHFKRPVSYRRMSDLGCVGGARLVTFRKISGQQFDEIIRCAYGEVKEPSHWKP